MYIAMIHDLSVCAQHKVKWPMVKGHWEWKAADLSPMLAHNTLVALLSLQLICVMICVCEELRQLPRKQWVENEGYLRLHEITRGFSPAGMRKWEALRELFADSLQRRS